jgi:uncharacterized membrane protein
MVLLALIVVVLAVALVRLQHALEAVREDLANARLQARMGPGADERLNALDKRIERLERQMQERSTFAAVEPPTASSAEQTLRAPEAETPAGPPAVTPPVEHDAPASRPLVPDPVVPPRPTPVSETIGAPVELPSRTAAPPPPPSPAEVPAAVPHAATRDGGDDAWEVVVGTSWLNKIGVLVFVVGLALLLGYSMAHVGPLGRVAIGYGLSLGMLGTGVVLERREMYRNYAYGLMGGGWAGVYFTTYAMHAVPAARVVDSELIGSLSLVLVAGGMIAHSLRYQSQTLSGLAYVAAYGPLAFSPLTMFSLGATIPLTASLLFMAHRFAWSGLAMLGIVSTYGILVLRTAGADAAEGTTALLVVSWSYWLLFEAADILGRRRPDAGSLFSLNAVGFLGSVLLHSQGTSNDWLVVATAATAYTASALVRARLLRPAEASPETNSQTFTTSHGAAAVAAGLFAYAIGLRFDGAPRTVAWLIKAELLVAAGLSLADRHVRRFGMAAAVLTTCSVTAVIAGDVPATGFRSVLSPSSVALLVALSWYGNREWLRQRHVGAEGLEHLYGWTGLLLVTTLLVREVPGGFRGAAAIGLALILLEAGLRRAAEYRYQAYVALCAAAALTGVSYFVEPILESHWPSFDRDVWIALPVVVICAYGFGVRMRRPSVTAVPASESAVVGAAAATIGTGFLALFEWHIAPLEVVPAVWAATAAAVTILGASRAAAVFRWHGYMLAAFSVLVSFAGLALDRMDSPAERFSVVAVVACAYLVAYLGRSMAPRAASAEAFASGAVALAGSALQALFVWRIVPANLVAPVWAASALPLIVLGARRDRPWQRWQAYGLILVANVRALGLLSGGESTAQAFLGSAAVVALSYFGGYLSGALRRTSSAEGSDAESLVAGLLSYLASLHLGLFSRELLPESREAAAWATTAVTLVSLGVWRGRAGQRIQGYAFFLAGLGRTVLDIAAPGDRDPASVAWTIFTVLAVYATALSTRPTIRASHAAARDAEGFARVGLLGAATVVLSALLVDEVGTRLATLAWALQGASLLAVGFAARERTLRLFGLGLLFACIGKLFLYDLRQLEALARILSFVVLGLVLLAVSWIYTRYHAQIRRLL